MSFEKPFIRPRRLRQNQSIRSLVQENRLHPSDLVYPVFITEGTNQSLPIDSMPNINRLSTDLAIKEIKSLFNKGIKGFALFPHTPNGKKDLMATESYNQDNLINNAIRLIKNEVPECIIFSDVALDPYTSHGHDGIIDDNGNILNDETIKILMKQAVSQAKSGADVICPSDMMDGRIVNIRNALDSKGFESVSIMSYAVKYASNFYGPFREALGNSNKLKIDKQTYQMNPANNLESITEANLDIEEGADMIMIKPAMSYLDIIKTVKQEFGVTTCAYQVSGEYTMLKTMIDNGYADKNIIMETMLSFKRAGADIIFTYFAPEILEMID